MYICFSILFSVPLPPHRWCTIIRLLYQKSLFAKRYTVATIEHGSNHHDVYSPHQKRNVFFSRTFNSTMRKEFECFPSMLSFAHSLSLSLWECFPYLLSYSTERSIAPLHLLMFLAYLCALFLKLTPLFTPVEKADTKQGRQQHPTTLVTEAKQSSHILSCLELVLSQTFTSEEEKLTR